MTATISKVKNGYIVELSKRDILTGKAEVDVTIHETLEKALDYIKDNK